MVVWQGVTRIFKYLSYSGPVIRMSGVSRRQPCCHRKEEQTQEREAFRRSYDASACACRVVEVPSPLTEGLAGV